MKKRSILPTIEVSAEELNRALRKYNQPTIDFTQTLLPEETIGVWMQKFKAANQRGHLLHYTNKGMQTKDYLLWLGSAHR